MSTANARQVAGTHYQVAKATQHWDYVAINSLGYFDGQISKYISRWPTKHSTTAGKLDDLNKAHHFLEKLIELTSHRTVHPTFQRYVLSALDWAKECRLGARETMVLDMLERWQLTGLISHLQIAQGLVAEIIALYEGSAAGAGYVNQDR